MASDLMLHGVLNAPLPDDPKELDIVTWVQFRERAREASERLQHLPDQIDIYRAIKRAGVRKHGDIARVIADLYSREPSSDD